MSYADNIAAQAGQGGNLNTPAPPGLAGGWSGYGQSGGIFASGSGGANATVSGQPYAQNINQANQLAQDYYNAGANFFQSTPQAQDRKSVV